MERERLEQAHQGLKPWKEWGPYLSERQWGTVREDYSADGNAWAYFSHDQARSRAYRWGEDGLAGVSDSQQRLCFALAVWNGQDPILKERLFGLTNAEGNHGEDCKEYYFYLDSTPTHSWMKYLYKYPQRAYPYADLVRTNASRNKVQPEYELIDTGVFAEDRYFDIFVTYAKATPNDLLIEITVANRGPEEASLEVLPTLWFRNTWSWRVPSAPPVLRRTSPSQIAARHEELGDWVLDCEGDPELLFTNNETNRARFGLPSEGPAYAPAFAKDAFHRYVIHGDTGAVNPAGEGTKAAARYRLTVPSGESRSVRLRLSANGHATPFADFARIQQLRQTEADEFYADLTAGASDDQALVIRQALAGMLWTKQYYYYDVDEWLRERGADPSRTSQPHGIRNRQWFHMVNSDIISMPDKWEYPWYAAWDLAFHTVALAMVDLDFAKSQLDLMLRETYLHPNGQIPAYEWNFGDVNPPVHAWAVYVVATYERETRGRLDTDFLEHAFQKLMMNFTWWVNRKDRSGNNVFEGGFLGLDNIGVFDRSAPIPGGGYLEQADGTAWMAFFSIFMFDIALELATLKPVYEEMACKFYEHFVWIASAMDRIGEHHDELWDEQDGFFYDVLKFPDGHAERLKVRSLVGLLPLLAVAVFPGDVAERFPRLRDRIARFHRDRRELLVNIATPAEVGPLGTYLLAITREDKMRRILERLFDGGEFWGPYGVRSLSKVHESQPYTLRLGDEHYRVAYEPAESSTRMFGGNSNWRGPVWLPMNVLIVRALMAFHSHYGDTFEIEVPTGSGRRMTLGEAALALSRNLSAIFLRDESGRRPVFGAVEKFQRDPHWRDLPLFYEYFHGDNGAGIGASHQTGWTGLVARLVQLTVQVTPDQMRSGAFRSLLSGESKSE